jgi:hypothetical protein
MVSATIDNDGVRFWARVVQATLIVLGAIGWLMGGTHWALSSLMVAVTIVIEIWGFHAYAQWSLALARREVALQCAYWFLVMIGCASWTMFSVYHAIPIIAGEERAAMGAGATPAYVAFAFLALSLPLHEWAIDRVERATLKSPNPKSRERASWRPQVVGATALSAIAAAGAAHAQTSASDGAKPPLPAGRTIVQMADAQAVRRDNAARARQLHSEGMNKSEIARSMGVHRNTIREWLKAA